MPNWHLCNLEAGGISQEKCRFCTLVKRGKQQVHVCVLHNEPLLTEEGFQVHKCNNCKKQANLVEDTLQQPSVPPQELMKYALDTYSAHFKQLIKEGYPVEIAEKYARQKVLNPNEKVVI